MITEPEPMNDYYQQEIHCVCCNNLLAVIDNDFKNLRFRNHDAKVNGFDLICYSCVEKLRKGRRLF